MANEVEVLKAQAEEDESDGILQEWVEDHLVRTLPLERFIGEEDEEELVEIICDNTAGAVPDLIDFLRSRAGM